MSEPAGGVRIGELGRRVGVSPELLRAWERRYGLLQPDRSAGGFRLYSADDEARVRAMQRHLANGLAAAQAARAARAEDASRELAAPGLHASRLRLQAALERYDESGAQLILDQLFGTFAAETIMHGVLLPVLATIGERWHAGEISVAEEHFASNLLRGRLLGLARGWGRGSGPLALLASPPGELHDMPLLMFGIALRPLGWRIAFLGADTPVRAIRAATEDLGADVVVLSTVAEERLVGIEHEISELTNARMLAIGGRGATPALAQRLGATLLEGDPVTGASALARVFAQ